MKKNHVYLSKVYLACFLFNILLIFSCSSDNPNIDPDSGSPATEIGKPQGEPVTKKIGQAGGSVTSADGRVELVIPEGALLQETDISVQPISNHAPNGLGLAYRFSPDGTRFLKPAALRFRYQNADVTINDSEMLRIATQKSDRTWEQAKGVVVDTLKRIIQAPMHHFSDWTAHEVMQLETLLGPDTPSNSDKYVDLGKSVDLQVVAVPVTMSNDTVQTLKIDHITWSVAGVATNGSVKDLGKTQESITDLYKARYTAPTEYPASNPVTITAGVTFKNLNKKFIVVRRVLVGKDYFSGHFGSTTFRWSNLLCNRSGDLIHISGWNDSPAQSVNILLNVTDSENPQGLYTYNVRRDLGAWVEYTAHYNGFGGWLSAMPECDTKVWRVSPDGVMISQVETVKGEEYIRGHFKGSFYNQPGVCPKPLRNESIDGEFRIKMNTLRK